MAGRTDTGVHALANVVSVDVGGGPPPERAAEALSSVLPLDLVVARAEAAPAEFSARFDARARSYRYRLWTRRERSPFEVRRSLWHPRPLDLERLNANAALLVGAHDFRAFTPERDAASSLRAHGRDGALDRRRRRGRDLRDHRRLVPAPHGAGARRDDARAERRRTSPRSSTAAPAPRRARRRRPGACTWSDVRY